MQLQDYDLLDIYEQLFDHFILVSIQQKKRKFVSKIHNLINHII